MRVISVLKATTLCWAPTFTKGFSTRGSRVYSQRANLNTAIQWLTMAEACSGSVFIR